MKYYFIHYCNPETNDLIFNIEYSDDTFKVNYGENVTVEESAKLFLECVLAKMNQNPETLKNAIKILNLEKSICDDLNENHTQVVEGEFNEK